MNELLNTPGPSNPSNPSKEPTVDEFDVETVAQPESNIRILKGPDGKLNGQQRRAWTKAANEYQNIVNWPLMDSVEIEKNMKLGKAHLQ